MTIRSGYPDCLAERGGKQVRIEFEYRSSSFVRHRHDPKACDWIVCWIHDWPAVPPHLRVVELRRDWGMALNAWLQPVSGEFAERISELNRSDL